MSIIVSPFFIELEPSEIFKVSAPSFFPAISKDVRVLVEFSKKRLIQVLSFNRFNLLLIEFNWIANFSESSNKYLIDKGSNPSIPRRCR